MAAPIVRLCKVISTIDDTDGDRIKVRFNPEDNHITNINEIPWAFPILPKFLHVKPKVGECVFVLTAQGDDGNSQRYYLGPVISQPHHMDDEPYTLDAVKYFKGITTPDVAPHMLEQTHGAFLKDNEVGLYGRKNTELKLSDSDVQLRAGVRLLNPNKVRDIHFNEKNPSYLKLKYHDKEQVTPNGQTYQTSATLVADKINLISNKSRDYFQTSDRNDLISDATMKEIIDKAHQLPYGDVLVEFLTLFRNAFLNHVHPYPRLKPCVDDALMKVQGYDLDKMLSDDIRVT